MRSFVIEQAVADITLEGSSIDGDLDDKKAEILFTYGQLEIQEAKAAKKSANIFMPQVQNIDINIETFESQAVFKQSNKSREFVADVDADPSDLQQMAYIKTGRILHYLFSTINTVDDVDASIAKLEMEGLLADSDITATKLKTMLDKRFQNRQVADWFSGKWTLFNECTILDYDPHDDSVKEHRPDRVMKNGDEVVIVDFKFGSPKPEYVEQVRRYMALTRSMGYSNVRGYLWFVYSNRIEQIS